MRDKESLKDEIRRVLPPGFVPVFFVVVPLYLLAWFFSDWLEALFQ